eukprot:Skav215676  [mRNA]  locus=scaffold278:75566:76081:- [translate_table: standard]
MNEIVREDDKMRLQPLLPLVRAMNLFLVDRGAEATEWPEENVSYRGAGMPEEQMCFFQSGLHYRCPMFLSTSFNQGVAMNFAREYSIVNYRRVMNRVVFHVHYDVNLRCQHVKSLKEIANNKREETFLFPPYSAFTVKSAPEPQGKHWVIHIEALPDNSQAPEDLPLALWH